MNLRDSAAFAGFSALRQIVRALPLQSAVRTGRAFGCTASHAFRRERRIAETQIRFALDRIAHCNHLVRFAPESDQMIAVHDAVLPPRRFGSTDDPKTLTSDVFGHVFESAVEALRLPTLLEHNPATKEFKHVRSTGQEHVAEVMKGGRGAITLSGHLGCFELLAAYHVAWGANVSVIGRDPNSSSVSKLVRDLRHSYGIATIWRDDAAAPKQWLSALQSGRVVAVLIDQDVQLENAFTPFFGLNAAYPITPIRMAIKREIPILSSFIVRTEKLQHHVVTGRLEYRKDDPLAAESVLAAFNTRLEDLICRFPEQWIWWHRRWRRRPGIDYASESGRLRSTEDYLSWLESGAPESEEREKGAAQC